MQTSDFKDFVNGVEARVNEIIDQTADLTPSFLASGLFDEVNNVDSLIYRTQGVTGLNYLEAKDEQGRLKEDRTYPAYETPYVMEEYGKVVSLSQMLMKTRSSDLEQKLNEARQLMISTNGTLKKHAWQILVNGFSTTNLSAGLPIARLDDGVAMFSTAHPSKVTGVANRSNQLAANPVYSESNQYTAITTIREQLNGRGLPIGYEQDFVVVVPPALEKLAVETNKSTKRPDTANNDLNYYEGIVDVISSVYLGNAANGQANADTTWYLIAKNPPEGQKSMKYVTLIQPKMETEVDFYTKAVNVSVDASWAMGYSNWEFMAASNGSAS